MKRPSKFININTKVLIFVLTVFCVFSIILSSIFSNYSKPAKIVSGAIVVPLQDGMNGIGKWFTNKADYFNSVKKLTKKNKELESQVNELTEENSLLAQNKYELERLRDLYQLDQDYSSYEKIAANVIGKDSGNWFDIFTINKGSKDGIKKDMNVISGGGLVGIVTDVGKDYAKVRAIIDDESSVSVSFANTSDTGIVSGDLKLMDDGVMNVTEVLKDAKVTEGDMVVTSKISDKFVPGILVGYVTNIKLDSSELTQSGQIIPVVDFKHIDEVLVITQLKDDM
ncbi:MULTISPECIES: rod shape-determining protein MreC [Eubacterium]|jgi:rod shape-determining protein MreC|uniref:Cell shape-determining protein MreC n=1 Tax=Eubacterium album TaxID=2978477 RepID=A0ABT2M3W8_9FIRM|nr:MULTISPECIES: rod shape-determining protein MreC [unclassified Eubacterium (in: firmicutes)]MCJ7965987.1 rod shape-determining protein MreC [Lachnospiraceae bacterium NSJ-171]MEE0294756.1 rod shape-determining protein MreC [Eubacterium sp.]CDA28221.1 cell shape-determining protein MreC [Eubacterium sp. CAG:156]MCT7399347.1 rod shape-determining protein MreC [Eubacterium sp. LFL-14]RGG66674.1 rod shape-determining protein MreC [Eubacterium sp. AF17-7]